MTQESEHLINLCCCVSDVNQLLRYNCSLEIKCWSEIPERHLCLGLFVMCKLNSDRRRLLVSMSLLSPHARNQRRRPHISYAIRQRGNFIKTIHINALRYINVTLNDVLKLFRLCFIFNTYERIFLSLLIIKKTAKKKVHVLTFGVQYSHCSPHALTFPFIIKHFLSILSF